MQCAFMGWPASLHQPLRAWMARNVEATRSGRREATERVAFEFDATIRAQLDARREAGSDAPDDVTTQLLAERIEGRPLSDEALVSLIRNWTVGELGTIAASVGVLLAYLAHHGQIQRDLRAHPERRSAGIDELLRMNGPLTANRRRVTRPVELGGRQLQPGDRVTIVWPSVDRDEAVFGDPDDYRPEANAEANLLYGTGIHACPGAPLARLELETLLDVVFARAGEIAPAAQGRPEPAAFPAGGYARVPIRLSPPEEGAFRTS
jgi:cytochrome P450